MKCGPSDNRHGGVQVGLGQGREGLSSRVTGWDEYHTRMTIFVT